MSPCDRASRAATWGRSRWKRSSSSATDCSLAGARAVYRGVQLQLSDLFSGNVRLRYTSVDFQGTLTQAALRAYLKPRPGAARHSREAAARC